MQAEAEHCQEAQYFQLRVRIMGKSSRHNTDRVKYHKCEVCLKNIPIEYYFTSGDAITCNGCNTEYTLLSKSPLELAMRSFEYPDMSYHDTY